MKGQGWPIATPGMAIGLLGGSFDPAHRGHVAITRAALARFALDRVWWLVSPGNPLKTEGPADMGRRITRARIIMRHPRVEITALEARLGTRFTADTLRALGECYPGVRLVWLMGADNLATLHHWDHWHDILTRVPMGVLARPGQRMRALNAPAARAYAAHRLAPRDSQRLAWSAPPAWCFVNLPMRSDSSSRIREAGDWTAP